jgi:hypothetical protein
MIVENWNSKKKFVNSCLEMSSTTKVTIGTQFVKFHACDCNDNGQISVTLQTTPHTQHSQNSLIVLSDDLERVFELIGDKRTLKIHLKNNNLKIEGHCVANVKFYDHVNYSNLKISGMSTDGMITMIGPDLAQQLLNTCIGNGFTDISFHDDELKISTRDISGEIVYSKKLNRSVENRRVQIVSKLTKPLVGIMFGTNQVTLRLKHGQFAFFEIIGSHVIFECFLRHVQ